MSFPAYPAYKKSDVEWLGEVPEHWILTPLKHLASLNPRKSGYDGDTEQLCSFVPMEKLKTGVVQLDEERLIEEVIGGYTYFEDGDVLQAKVTPCFENKNIAIAKGLTNGIGFGSSEINVLRPYQGVNAEYLYYRVQEDSYMDFCTSSMIGAGGLKRVPTDVINNFKVAKPEIFEQTQIASFLGHETARIDALIEEQQRLIELLKEKRQAVISHTVTKGLDPTVQMKDSGVEWLGKVPAHWRSRKMKRLFTQSKRQGYTDMEVLSVYRDYGVVKKSSRDDNNNKTPDDLSLYQLVMVGDLVVNKMKAWQGSLGVSEYQGITSPDYVVYSPSHGETPRFLHYLLRASHMPKVYLSISNGIRPSQWRIEPEKFEQVEVFLPGKAEQLEIVTYLENQLTRINELMLCCEQASNFFSERRSALISAAVTGKIDVRGWQPPASVPTPKLVQEVV